MKLNCKINGYYNRDITSDYKKEIEYISKKHGIKISEIYISDHPCGEATIFGPYDGKYRSWLGYIDASFYYQMELDNKNIDMLYYESNWKQYL